MIGMAVAFPIAIGMALVLGTVVNYTIQVRGSMRGPGRAGWLTSFNPVSRTRFTLLSSRKGTPCCFSWVSAAA